MPAAGTSRLTPEMITAIAKPCSRGGSFNAACRAQRVHPETGRYWRARGRLELEKAAQDLPADALPEALSVYAQFAVAIDQALGEAVLSASERAWDSNPVMWLRYSHARTEFYPVEARAALANMERERQAEVAVRHRLGAPEAEVPVLAVPVYIQAVLDHWREIEAHRTPEERAALEAENQQMLRDALEAEQHQDPGLPE